MITPPLLGPGSRIRVVSPASPVKDDFLRSGMQFLCQQGWEVEGPARGIPTHFYCAGLDVQRMSELADALADPTAKAVWFARGGYGSGRLLPLLDRAFSQAPPSVKAIVGCSDTTFLLLYFLQRWGWVVFHGPMVAGDLSRDESHFDGEYLVSLLRGQPSRRAVVTKSLEVLAHGPAAVAPLTGGCLSILVATLGTPYQWETDDRIIFLEDSGIKPYQLDRMLIQLRQAGKFDRTAGIVFGEMPECTQHPQQGYTIQEAIRFALAGLSCPVLFGLPSGHTHSPSLPLALGAVYRLDPAAGNIFLEDMHP